MNQREIKFRGFAELGNIFDLFVLEKEKKKLIKKIKGMRKKTNDDAEENWKNGYNQALDDILSLRELSKKINL